jgi:hypothetical protein
MENAGKGAMNSSIRSVTSSVLIWYQSTFDIHDLLTVWLMSCCRQSSKEEIYTQLKVKLDYPKRTPWTRDVNRRKPYHCSISSDDLWNFFSNDDGNETLEIRTNDDCDVKITQANIVFRNWVKGNKQRCTWEKVILPALQQEAGEIPFVPTISSVLLILNGHCPHASGLNCFIGYMLHIYGYMLHIYGYMLHSVNPYPCPVLGVHAH